MEADAEHTQATLPLPWLPLLRPPDGLRPSRAPPTCLHRHLASEVKRTVDACCEVLLPVELTPEQIQSYQTVLVRQYEGLADTRPPKHAGHRAACLKHVCSELLKVRASQGLSPD